MASGGFQVEEYARLQFPEGKLIDSPYKNDNYQFFHDETKDLLKNENVTIFEAGFLYKSLFIRTDILVKKGNEIKLIEVKAKSYDPREEHTFTTKKGKIVSSWKPYLFDLAFQTYVTKKSYPNCNVTSYLYLVDKTKSATINGLNQMFRVKKKSDKRTGVEVLANTDSDLGENLMGLINHSETVQKIINNEFKYYDNLGFEEAINLLKSVRLENKYPNWPTSFSSCKNCEFKLDNGASEKNISGFEYCFKKQHNWKSTDFKKSNIFNIWDFKNDAVFEQGKYFKEDLSEEDVKLKPKANRISRTERQWLQIEKERDNDLTEYFDKEGFLNESRKWKYPFHFIDFETSTVPLPFHMGRSAYEQIAFQFSHHILHEDGKIEHASEYINTKPGEFPNFIFMQHLHDALVHDHGTVFRYATHENTILNTIRMQLLASNYGLKEELIQFIESISHPTGNTANKWDTPQRDMVDLCQTIKYFYYHPKTYGSNSIKKVLPAILSSSEFIQKKYSQPIGNIRVSSKNFDANHIWLVVENGNVISPYSMLPSVHDDMSKEEFETSLSQIENIGDGGAALTAYGKIQYTDMSKDERRKIGAALKRYCELDTLAMVMIYEHLNSICK
ncbi:DUF2779 domain-containing protein [Flavobacteriales bacterium]|nr:DUF2779 domain-containing protein [Flavobacteriales bacterium]